MYVHNKAKHVTILASIKAAWYTNKGFDWLIDWLIDWLLLNVKGAVFQLYGYGV